MREKYMKKESLQAKKKIRSGSEREEEEDEVEEERKVRGCHCREHPLAYLLRDGF